VRVYAVWYAALAVSRLLRRRRGWRTRSTDLTRSMILFLYRGRVYINASARGRIPRKHHSIYPRIIIIIKQRSDFTRRNFAVPGHEIFTVDAGERRPAKSRKLVAGKYINTLLQVNIDVRWHGVVYKQAPCLIISCVYTVGNIFFTKTRDISDFTVCGGVPNRL